MGVWLWGPLAVFEKAVQAWDGAVQNSCISSCSNRQFWSCTFLCNWSWRRAVAQTIKLIIQPTPSLFRSKIVGINIVPQIRSLLNWLLAGRKAVGRQQQQTATIITTTLQLVFPFWQVAKLLPHNHLPVSSLSLQFGQSFGLALQSVQVWLLPREKVGLTTALQPVSLFTGGTTSCLLIIASSENSFW